jgi:hypothetical protein
MKSINIMGGFGISGSLMYCKIFEMLLEKQIVTDIYFCVNYKSYIEYRGDFGDSFYNKYTEILNFIFNNNKHIHVCPYSEEFANTSPPALCSRYNYQLKMEPFEHLSSNIPIINGKYITVSMKVMWNVSEDIFNQMVDNLYDVVHGNTNLPIVLIGERTITDCVEYRGHNVYSMYSKLKTLNNILDYTIAETKNTNDLEDLKKSFNIMRHSQLNIFFSTAGISAILPFVSTKVIGWAQGFPTEFDIKTGSEDVEIYHDQLLFMKCLKNRLHRIS